jgi:FlaA1/EpsC-like NDP-sugar epimerase
MKRYFMTIPEASELVIQAGGLASNAEIFVLDMGKPELIVDLARRMISGAGLTEKTTDNPNGDIAITFTKPRPGEKMYEELSYVNHLNTTDHEMIHQSNEGVQDLEEIKELIDLLERAVDNRDDEKMLELVCKVVPEYIPSDELCSSTIPTIEITNRETKETV